MENPTTIADAMRAYLSAGIIGLLTSVTETIVSITTEKSRSSAAPPNGLSQALAEDYENHVRTWTKRTMEEVALSAAASLEELAKTDPESLVGLKPLHEHAFHDDSSPSNGHPRNGHIPRRAPAKDAPLVDDDGLVGGFGPAPHAGRPPKRRPQPTHPGPLAQVRHRQIVAFLLQNGFGRAPQKGKHDVYIHNETGHRVPLPCHGGSGMAIKPGTVKGIFRRIEEATGRPVTYVRGRVAFDEAPRGSAHVEDPEPPRVA